MAAVRSDFGYYFGGGKQQASLEGVISLGTELTCAGSDHSGGTPATYKGTPHTQ